MFQLRARVRAGEGEDWAGAGDITEGGNRVQLVMGWGQVGDIVSVASSQLCILLLTLTGSLTRITSTCPTSAMPMSLDA